MYHCILMKKIKKFIKKVTLTTKINAPIKPVKVNLSLFKKESFKFHAPLIREIERFVLNHKSLKISHKYKKMIKEIEAEKKVLKQKGRLIFINPKKYPKEENNSFIIKLYQKNIKNISVYKNKKEKGNYNRLDLLEIIFWVLLLINH